jgi:hypothetical protein
VSGNTLLIQSPTIWPAGDAEHKCGNNQSISRIPRAQVSNPLLSSRCAARAIAPASTRSPMRLDEFRRLRLLSSTTDASSRSLFFLLPRRNELALMQVVTLNMSVSFLMRISSPPPPPRFEWASVQKLQIRVR